MCLVLDWKGQVAIHELEDKGFACFHGEQKTAQENAYKKKEQNSHNDAEKENRADGNQEKAKNDERCREREKTDYRRTRKPGVCLFHG